MPVDERSECTVRWREWVQTAKAHNVMEGNNVQNPAIRKLKDTHLTIDKALFPR
jgi:hypothetical protein